MNDDITDEQIDDLMREAGMEEIEEADYRHGQGEQMTISEQERLDTARKFARLVLALRPSGRKEECCILKVAATRDGMKCSRGVLGCVAVHDEDVPAASAAPVEPSLFLRMVDGFYARTELEEWFHDIFEDDEYLTFEEMIFDDYDSSIELLGCLPDLRLKPEHQQALWDQGVATIWLNHKDGMQTRYTKPNYSYYNPTGPDGVRYPQPDRQKTRASPPPPTEEPVDRDAALEEAAKACKSLSDRRGFTKDQRQMADKCAAVILAMKDGTGENHGT